MTPVGIRICVGVYLATSKGRIRLQSPDPGVQPELVYNLLQTEEDLARMRQGVRAAAEFFDHPAFEPLVDK